MRSAEFSDRHLDWDGCFNARDLGGLLTTDGRRTRWGAVVRADRIDGLTKAGWSALSEYGIQTIVDLRNDDERKAYAEIRAGGITTVHMPLDDVDDTELWKYIWENELDGSPLYYRRFLDRKPERCAAAVAAVARAGPGGVVVHCTSGRDRAGLITLLLLALVDVRRDDIVSDYELSTQRLRRRYAELGEADAGPVIQEILERKNTSARDAILATLASLDVESYLRSGGLADEVMTAVRARLLEQD